MRAKIGERVGAVLDIKNGVVRLLGYGVYEADEVPDASATGFGPMVREAGITNPRIRLDNGKVVWGCECWWGPEDAVRAKLLKATTVVEVDVDEARNISRAEEAAALNTEIP